MPQSGFIDATRASYDTIAEVYTARVRDELAARPLERAMLGGFAELVTAAGLGPVADLGCGPGRVTAHLDGLGVDAFGIDLSPRMISQARAAYPTLRFETGTMLALDLADGHLGGIVAWYSIIHVPDEDLPATFAEFHRVLAPGGYLLLAFQTGEQVLHRTMLGGHAVDLDFHRRRPEDVADLLARHGLVMHARLIREPDDVGGIAEETAQAFLLAHKPAL